MNDQTPVNGESGTSAPTVETPHPHEPHIEILKGHPTEQQLAALVAVLGSITPAAPAAAPEPARWGLPVDKLRYPVFSWQRITLQEMTHMRR
ncbi:acyl-CoA carboxylase subunit epsilon [Mycobacterium spongiae]|uniref:Acyl-CoA carboxylase subunit epsilon n=1 Tax=Mycobacterium spongiae TaxID=886343 RepID=A0A975PWE6_9MYCO|nr:acyl-CoA carboxylase subunit epsilon [Mycobacterium spongiae]